jgi:predicted ABC-type ATPase
LKPVLLVIAGPNGSGKTTVTLRLRRERWSEGVEYINPDDIAQERFGGWNNQDAVTAAAEWASKRRDELIQSRSGIAFETVLSVSDKVAFVERAVNAGYFVRVFFVGTSDPTINAARVAARVMNGGHTVPIEKIISRYTRSMANLRKLFALADRAYIYDNSVDRVDAALCAQVREGELRKVYGPLPDWVEQALIGVTPSVEFVDARRS